MFDIPERPPPQGYSLIPAEYLLCMMPPWSQFIGVMAGSARCHRWMLAVWIIAVLWARPSHGSTKKMDIHRMHIESKVTSRFSRTLITMEVRNPANFSQEAVFDIELPKTAFITSFSMTVDNVTNVGVVKEKIEAKRQYQAAMSRGKSAGLVQSTGRKMEHFKVSVNVGSQAQAIFKLTYEELLKRQLGSYELYLRVRPRELVQNFQINVDVVEQQGISFLKTVGTFISNELADIIMINRTETEAHIEFKPTMDQQRSCPNCVETVLDGELMIKYDVKRESAVGKVQVINGYFVHYFAPPSLKRIPKNVVFVIDHSGSMYGNKIKQTYEAFLKILEDVPEEDHFGILIFDDKVDEWKTYLVKAVPENIKEAKQFVSRISARGGTDINKALLTAAKMLRNATINNMLPKVSASIIIFLSDGEPTSGTTNHDKIIDNLKRSLEGQASLYCLGFGRDVDYNFLEKLALENGGLARRIYEDSDSALQLQGFYNEVAYPMLLDVRLQYLDNSVDDLTQSSFRHYYQGSEIIVAGHITNNSLDVLSAEVTAQGVSEPFSQRLETNLKEEDNVAKEQHYIFRDFTERLWAYLTIEQLLTKLISLEGQEKRQVTEKTLNLSLKYHFVTPLTSIVVTPPEKEDTHTKIVAHKPKEDEQSRDFEFDDFQDIQSPASLAADSHYYVAYAETVEEAEDEMLLLQATEAATEYTMVPTRTTAPEAVCDAFHVLLKAPQVSEKLCVQISQTTDVYICLFYDDSSGITLNGKLAGDRSFEQFGLVNNKLKLKVEIAAAAVTVMHGADVNVYGWDSTFRKSRFLQKDNERITVNLTSGVHFTIFRVEQSLRLYFSAEDGHPFTGVIGQFIDNRNVSIDFKSLNVAGEQYAHHSLTGCDLAPYGDEDGSPCLFISHQTTASISDNTNIVQDLFTSPPKSP